ncbi:MAG: hypothetical protein ACYCZH_01605 [Sulfuriferula sp.]
MRLILKHLQTFFRTNGASQLSDIIFSGKSLTRASNRAHQVLQQKTSGEKNFRTLFSPDSIGKPEIMLGISAMSL